MTISELIKELEKFKEENGDLSVFTNDFTFGEDHVASLELAETDVCLSKRCVLLKPGEHIKGIK